MGTFLTLVTPLRFLSLIEPRITDITPNDFYQEFSKNPDDYIFIDVRSVENYASGHPAGAVNMPLQTMYVQRQHLPKSGKTIVLTCGGDYSSGVAFSYLQHFGFFNIKRIPGGLPAWKAAGLPTVEGLGPYATSTSRVLDESVG